MKKIIIILTLFAFVAVGMSQSEGDYRDTDGFANNWSDVSTWEVYSGGAWGAAASVPTNITTTVTVSNVTLKVVMDVDVTLNGGALQCGKQVEVSTGKTFTYTSGTILNSGKILVKGTLNYNKNGGTIPSCDFGTSGCLVELTGITSTAPSQGSGDTYRLFQINSPSMTTFLDLNNFNYAEDLTITNTGSGYVYINTNMDKSSNVTIEAAGVLKIGTSGKLTMTATLTNNAGSSGIVIMSTSSGTGSLITDQSVQGTMNQYIPSGQWHLVGISTTSATLGDFNPSGGDGYMRGYVTADSDWGSYMTNLSDPLSVCTGYEYWTTVNNTVTLTGTFNTGNQGYTMSSAGNKYNLISNPYPCAIDWESVSDNTHATSQSIFYYSNTAGTNGYAVYSAATSSGTYGATQYIPPFQGFFVEQTSATDMDFTNSDKAHPDHILWKNNKAEGVSDRLRLNATEIVGEDTLWSEMVIVYVDGATNGYDAMIDTKMPENNYVVAPEIYSKADDQNITINAIGSYPAVVPLELEIIDAGQLTITMTEMSDWQESTGILLEDRETGIFYVIDDSFNGITFDVQPGIISDRFFVHYDMNVGVGDMGKENATIYSNKNRVYFDLKDVDSYDIEVVNMLGQSIYSGHKVMSGLQSITIDQPAAYYVVRVTTEEQTYTQKLYLAN